MRRFFLPLTVAALILGFLVWAFRPVPVAVETALVAPRDISVTIEEEGEAQIRDVYTVSAPLAGRLRRIALHPGDRVVAGETVVAAIGPAESELLDPRSRAVASANLAAAEAAMRLGEAQVAQAEASASFARAEAARDAALFDRAAISRRGLDAANLAAQTADAALASARAQLSVRQGELDKARAMLDGGGMAAPETCCAEIRAPVSGSVLRVLTTSAQTVLPGTPLLEIGDLDEMEIRAELLSRDAVRVAQGAAAVIDGWGGAPLPARVRRISPSAETRVSALGIEEQRVEVLLDIDAPAAARAGLGHGFRVLVRIALWSGRNVLSLPVGALFREGENWAVYTVEDGRARLRTVRLGERDADNAQVLDGVAEGAVVILNPSDRVGAGVRVAAEASP